MVVAEAQKMAREWIWQSDVDSYPDCVAFVPAHILSEYLKNIMISMI